MFAVPNPGSLIWRFFLAILAVLGGFPGLWRFWRFFGGSGGSWRFPGGFGGSGGFSWQFLAVPGMSQDVHGFRTSGTEVHVRCTSSCGNAREMRVGARLGARGCARLGTSLVVLSGGSGGSLAVLATLSRRRCSSSMLKRSSPPQAPQLAMPGTMGWTHITQMFSHHIGQHLPTDDAAICRRPWC